MRASRRMRWLAIGALTAGGLLGLGWGVRATAARPVVPARQFGGSVPTGGFGGGVDDPELAGRVVYLRESLSPRALAIRARLSQPLDMSFDQETPLEDVVRFIREATDSPDMKGGLPIYLDPIGLTEAEKTPSSPVVMSLKGIPLGKTLRLTLKQLGLAYVIDEDGFLLITSESAAEVPADPSQAILDELTQLRRDVAELKALLGGHAPRGAVDGGMGAGGGGMR